METVLVRASYYTLNHGRIAHRFGKISCQLSPSPLHVVVCVCAFFFLWGTYLLLCEFEPAYRALGKEVGKSKSFGPFGSGLSSDPLGKTELDVQLETSQLVPPNLPAFVQSPKCPTSNQITRPFTKIIDKM